MTASSNLMAQSSVLVDSTSRAGGDHPASCGLADKRQIQRINGNDEQFNTGRAETGIYNMWDSWRGLSSHRRRNGVIRCAGL